MTANLNALKIRPTSGGSFARASFCAGLSQTAFEVNVQLNVPSIPSTSWIGGQYFDQPHPGGGSV